MSYNQKAFLDLIEKSEFYRKYLTGSPIDPASPSYRFSFGQSGPEVAVLDMKVTPYFCRLSVPLGMNGQIVIGDSGLMEDAGSSAPDFIDSYTQDTEYNLQAYLDHITRHVPWASKNLEREGEDKQLFESFYRVAGKMVPRFAFSMLKKRWSFEQELEARIELFDSASCAAGLLSEVFCESFEVFNGVEGISAAYAYTIGKRLKKVAEVYACRRQNQAGIKALWF